MLTRRDTGLYAVRVQSEQGACSSQATLLVQPQPPSPQRREELSPKRRAAPAMPVVAVPVVAAAAAAGPSAPPEFLKLFRDYRVAVGENVALDCVIRAVPRPSIVWTYNGEPIAERPGAGVHITEEDEHYGLLLEHVREAHSGRYAITAENSSGRATCSALLTVLSQPHPPPDSSSSSWFVGQQVLPAAEHVPAKVPKLFNSAGAPASERNRSPTRAPLQPLGPGGAPRHSSPSVRAPPPPPVAPRFVKPLNDLSAQEGARVQFDALVDGFPEPSVQVCVAFYLASLRCTVHKLLIGDHLT